MPTLTAGKSGSIGGVSFSQSINLSADAALVQEESMVAADAGVLTTRTDNDTGEITLDDSDAVVATGKVDVYWDGGRRYNMDATLAAGVLTVDGGSGDNLPTEDTEVTVMNPKVLSFELAADFVHVALLAKLTQLGIVIFWTGASGSGTPVLAWDVGLNQQRDWNNLNGQDDPIGAVVINHVSVSHGGVVAATAKVGALYNNA